MTTQEGPFLLSDCGLPPHTVPRDFRRIHRSVYAPPSGDLGPIDTIRAAWLRAGPDAVVGGVSAAVLHGASFFDHRDHVELIRPPTGQGRVFNDVHIVRTDLGPGEVVWLYDMPVTSPVRTAYDLGRRSPAWLALAHLDDLTQATGLDLAELWRFIVGHPAVRNIRQIRGLVPWIDPHASIGRLEKLLRERARRHR